MAPAPASVLAINGGSSSIKFAVYHAGTLPKPSLSGKLDRIGLTPNRLLVPQRHQRMHPGRTARRHECGCDADDCGRRGDGK
jgi:acetate kinase